jgi:demethylmenaquinone methyltransferase / 2-methoxy-6-polyprenyl-1,4-benzoquinol methylase
MLAWLDGPARAAGPRVPSARRTPGRPGAQWGRMGVSLSPRTRHARTLFAPLGPSYDRAAGLLSFGQDPRWRRSMVSRVRTGPGATVLDVATGTAAVALELLSSRPGIGRVVGLDQSEPMLREGLRRVSAAGRSDRFAPVLGSGDRLPFTDGSFDAVTFTYLLRYVDDPGAALRELARVLRPGGTLANLEFHVPANPAWRGLWWLYTRVGLPLGGRLLSREWADVGRFLGPSISGFYRSYPLSAQLELWREAGMADVRARVMSLGGGVVIWGTKEAR